VKTPSTRETKKSTATKLPPVRAHAKQNLTALLSAAAEVFATSGVDAPVREIAQRAGVGLGTVYRHFPQRSDLIVAVMQSHVEACADAAAVFASEYEPEEALARWLHRLMDFVGAKRGLAAALHSGDPAYAALPGYVMERLGGALRELLDGAIAVKAVRSDIDAEELLWTVATMCRGPYGEKPAYAGKMVDVLIDGLRYGANPKEQLTSTAAEF
jgi:AcrR family transcriptional regulator